MSKQDGVFAYSAASSNSKRKFQASCIFLCRKGKGEIASPFIKTLKRDRSLGLRVDIRGKGKTVFWYILLAGDRKTGDAKFKSLFKRESEKNFIS